jgi:glyoxylase-like metal-dependent hydrolase (beta-lactamase superfamily II)
MQIIPLSEGSFTIDKSKVFVPFDTSSEILQSRPPGSILVEIQPFVIITSKDVILIDTGLGYAGTNGELQIHENLEKAGIRPASITKVLISHLHKDHAGGTTFSNIDNTARYISFPYATYYIQQREFNSK